MRYVLWDWNGTLLDDTQAALDTLNRMLCERGAKPIAMDYYRDHFAFPVKPFYEQIGMKVDPSVWDQLAVEYHRIYAAMPKALNNEALAALRKVRDAGLKQSIISALRQDLLDAATAEYGVKPFMEYVYGVDNLNGCSKLDRARELLSRILVAETSAATDLSDVVLIGDALHDKEVADALGIRCVLCGQGSHAAWRLREVAPTGDTVLEAAELALRLQ